MLRLFPFFLHLTLFPSWPTRSNHFSIFSCLFILCLDFIVSLNFQVFSGILTNLIFFPEIPLFPSIRNSYHLSWQQLWTAFPKFFLWWKTPTFSGNLTASEGNFQSPSYSFLCVIYPPLFWYVPTKHQQSLDCSGHTSRVWMLCVAGWVPSHWSVDLLNRRKPWSLHYVLDKILTLHTDI